MELGPTSYVLLGTLAMGPRSGYDIKQLAETSMRHFWSISYGQIYPELRRLATASLVKAEDAPRGTRQRTVYHLTARGRQVFAGWETDPAIKRLELRDEMLVKLFFADAMPRRDVVRHLDAMSRRHREVADGLRAHERVTANQPHRMRQEVARFGIGMHEWCADFYEGLAKEAKQGRATKR